MKKKDLIFYAGTAVLLAFSTQQVKADEQHASDQTPENTSAIVATTTSSEAQNTVSEGVGVEKGIQTENTVATEAAPVTPTLSNNQSSDKGTSDKVVSEQPAQAVVASRAPYGARARVVAARNESVPQQESPVSADLTIAKSESDGTFTITAKNLQGLDGYEEVKIPFWSHANGMKDIIWYTPSRQADGSYTVTAKASDHENADGKYEAQVFYVDANGQNKFVKKAFIDYKNQSRPTASLLIQNNNKDAGTFDVIIKDVYSPKGVRTVQVPTWSDKDGQDDIRWYEATRQSNGDYKVSVKASDHKNSTGKYHIHLYYIQNDGSRVGVGSTTTEVEFRNAQTKTQTGIKNVNSGAGTYTVTVDQAPQGRRIKNIRVAAWSQAHQENLFWYSTAPSGMHTEVQVSAANHQYQSGNYTTHVYVDYVDGGVEGFNLGQTALHPRATVDQTAFSPRVTNGQRDRVLRAAASLVGVRGGTAAHHQLVNDYNSVKPLPVGYAVKTTDDWCDIFVTTVFQREGLSGLIGRECGVERHIQIFKRLGIWNEDGTTTPKAGDIITFNWDQNSQQNNGFADHIGIVESVSNGIIHTIEGKLQQPSASQYVSDWTWQYSWICNPSLSITKKRSPVASFKM